MGTRTDALLAGLVLVAAAGALVAVEASVSPIAAALGGLGTIAFELLAARDPETVRRWWDRPVVQGLSVAVALVGIAIGATVAASSALSFALGALATYLAFVAIVALR